MQMKISFPECSCMYEAPTILSCPQWCVVFVGPCETYFILPSRCMEFWSGF